MAHIEPFAHTRFVAGLALGFLSLGTLSSPGRAATSTWNTVSGNWNAAESWDGGTPDVSGTAVINNSGTALVPYTVFGSYADLLIGSIEGGSGVLSIDGGSLSGTNASLGHAPGGTGSAIITSGTWHNSGELTIGYSGTGSLLIEGGTVTTHGFVEIGHTGHGSVTVTSGTFDALLVGIEGDGSLLIDGGLVSAAGVIGNKPSGNATATVTSGTWLNSSLIAGNFGTGSILIDGGYVSSILGYIGQEHSGNGIVTVSSGTWENIIGLYVGENGTGHLLVDGGLVSGSNGYIGYGSGTATATVTSGTWATSSAHHVGEYGAGSLLINGGLVTGSNGYIGSLAEGSGTATVTSGTWAIATEFAVGHSGTGTLLVNGGMVSSHRAFIGQNPGSHGSATVSSGTWAVDIGLFVGYEGTGSLLVDGGHLLGDGLIGFDPTGHGTATVSSGTWEAIAIVLGTEGHGTLIVNGGLTTARITEAGYSGAGSTGSGGYMGVGDIIVSGGTLANSIELIVGSSGPGSLLVNGGYVSNPHGYLGRYVSEEGNVFYAGSGSATVTSGTWNNVFDLSVGYSGTGNLLVNGGLVTGSNSYIGYNADGIGIATVTSGKWANSADLSVGHFGTGSLMINGGMVSVSGTAYVGFGSSGTGTITLSGSSGSRGVLSASRVMNLAGSGTLIFDGGILRGQTDENDLLSGFETTNVAINNGGAFIDSNGHAVGIATTMGGTGGLTKQGSGTLTLSSSNTYSGTTAVDAGTLKLTDQSSSRAFAIDAGATLELNVASGSRDYGFSTPAILLTGSGSLVKTGAGSVRWENGAAEFALGTGSVIEVQAGELIGGSNAGEVWINNRAALHVASGALFNGENANVRVDALSGSGTIRSGYAGAYEDFTFGAADGSGTFSGVLADNGSDAGSYVKTGTGTQILTGSNTYTGATTVKNGALEIGAGGSITHGSSNIYVGDASGDKGTLRLSGGVITNLESIIGNAVGAIGSAVITSGTWNSSSDLFVGRSGSGSLMVAGGLVSISGTYSFIGYDPGANGTVTVSSGTLTSFEDFAVGVSGTGHLLINGGRVSSDFGIIGGNTNGIGSSTVTSGTWDNSGLYVGLDGTGDLMVDGGYITGSNGYVGAGFLAQGNATVRGGTWENSHEFHVGYFGTGSLVINGGLVTDANASIGFGAGARGSVTMASGTWSNSADLSVGRSGTGSLLINGGVVSVSGTVYVGFDSSGTGTITLSGSSGNRGVLSASRVMEISGTGMLAFNGGILRAAADHGDFISGFEAGEVTTGPGGAFIDTNGFAIKIGTALSGTGGLTKQGAGTLTLSGSNSYHGATVIEEGMMIVVGDSSETSAFTVNVGATLGGTGTISGATVAGTLAPGASPGLLTIEGDLAMQASSTLMLEFDGTAGGTFAQLAVGGLFTAGGILYLDVDYAAAWGDSFVVFTDMLPTLGSFTVQSNLGGGLYWDTTQLTSAGILNVVPEPTAAGPLALGGAMIAFLRRRPRA